MQTQLRAHNDAGGRTARNRMPEFGPQRWRCFLRSWGMAVPQSPSSLQQRPRPWEEGRLAAGSRGSGAVELQQRTHRRNCCHDSSSRRPLNLQLQPCCLSFFGPSSMNEQVWRAADRDRFRMRRHGPNHEGAYEMNSLGEDSLRCQRSLCRAMAPTVRRDNEFLDCPLCIAEGTPQAVAAPQCRARREPFQDRLDGLGHGGFVRAVGTCQDDLRAQRHGLCSPRRAPAVRRARLRTIAGAPWVIHASQPHRVLAGTRWTSTLTNSSTSISIRTPARCKARIDSAKSSLASQRTGSEKRSAADLIVASIPSRLLPPQPGPARTSSRQRA